MKKVWRLNAFGKFCLQNPLRRAKKISVDGIIVATRAADKGDEYLESIVENSVPVVVIEGDFFHE